MTALAGPYLIVCAILGVGGVAKLIAPQPARRAMHALGLTVPRLAVRSLGLAEIVLAALAALVGGRVLPVIVGLAYLAFAGFVALVLRSENAGSCGCFGSRSAPPSWLHVVVNLASAGAAVAASGIDSLGRVLDEQPAAGLPLLGLVALGSYLLFLLLTALPEALSPPQPVVAEFSIADGAAL